MGVRIINADVMDGLAQIESESVNCVVTSPPYFGLRDYGVEGQIGLEPTPDAYVAKLVGVFREVRRVLRKDGTCWLNLGDSYAANGARSNNNGEGSSTMGWPGQRKETLNKAAKMKLSPLLHGCKPKDLIGIPWRVAFALQADGWWLRQDIIWSKPNPMPESVTDRCTKAHEYLFLLTKAERYFYDAEAIKEDNAEPKGCGGWQNAIRNGEPHRYAGQYKSRKIEGAAGGSAVALGLRTLNEGRNKRSVWEVTTQPFPEAHFATFPPALIEPCIKAGCPETVCAKCGAPWMREVERKPMVLARSDRTHSKGRTRTSGTMLEPPTSITLGFAASCNCGVSPSSGVVLDPFGGSGTTGLVADRLKRNAILIELNSTYAEMARRRIENDCPLFTEVANASA